MHTQVKETLDAFGKSDGEHRVAAESSEDPRIVAIRKLINRAQYGTRYSINMFVNELIKIVGEENK